MDPEIVISAIEEATALEANLHEDSEPSSKKESILDVEAIVDNLSIEGTSPIFTNLEKPEQTLDSNIEMAYEPLPPQQEELPEPPLTAGDIDPDETVVLKISEAMKSCISNEPTSSPLDMSQVNDEQFSDESSLTGMFFTDDIAHILQSQNQTHDIPPIAAQEGTLIGLENSVQLESDFNSGFAIDALDSSISQMIWNDDQNKTTLVSFKHTLQKEFDSGLEQIISSSNTEQWISDIYQDEMPLFEHTKSSPAGVIISTTSEKEDKQALPIETEEDLTRTSQAFPSRAEQELEKYESAQFLSGDGMLKHIEVDKNEETPSMPAIGSLSRNKLEECGLTPNIPECIPEPIPESSLRDISPSSEGTRAPVSKAEVIELTAKLWQDAYCEIEATGTSDFSDIELSLTDILQIERNDKFDLLFDLVDDEIRNPDAHRTKEAELPKSETRNVIAKSLEKALLQFSTEEAIIAKNPASQKTATIAKNIHILPAPLWRRMGSFVVDTGVFVAVALVVLAAQETARDVILGNRATLEVFPTLGLSLIATIWIWTFLNSLLIFGRGRTVGQKVFQLEVVTNSANIPSLTTAILRSLSMFVTIASCGLGILPMLWGSKQPLHDRMAATRTRVAR